MKYFKKHKYLLVTFMLFAGINGVLYLWMNFGHTVLPFSRDEYVNDAHHYIADPRIHKGAFSLLNALGQYDSQWYLKIAEVGYPAHPPQIMSSTQKTMGGMIYNFFPFYPLCIALINFFVRNVELSAFLFSIMIQISIFFSAYYVVSRWYSEKIAAKTILLITLYPFSIFLHGYYNEGLRLLLFIWLCYWITQKKFFLSAISISLLCVTSGVSLLLPPFFFVYLFLEYRKHEVTFKKFLLYCLVTGVPFFFWLLFCYAKTGNPICFVVAMMSWGRPYSIPILQNILLLFSYPWLPMRGFHGSQLDELVILFTIWAVYVSKKVLPRVIWGMTAVLALTPLLVQDSVSFARFSLVLFPFFVAAAQILKQKYFWLTLIGFSVGLLIVSIGFINWYWIE